MISIHALLAESDTSILHKILADWGFLSTLSLRRATRVSAGYPAYSDDFYPRSPCGERLKASATPFSDDPISIHALLAESDTIFAVRPYDAPIFLSTLSLRRATEFRKLLYPGSANFYPRSPCGERRISSTLIIGFSGFLSTLSLRRATASQTNLPSEN